MVKIRRDLNDWPIEEWAVTVVKHAGDWGLSTSNTHLVWAVHALNMPPDATWARTVGPWAPAGVILIPAINIAFLLARLIVAEPNIAQDVCPDCRSGARGPNCPRMNIHRGPHPPILTPCILQYWW